MNGDLTPWSIKNVPAADREKINMAAKRVHLTVGAWLCKAAAEAIERERTPLAVADNPRQDVAIISSAPVPDDFEAMDRMLSAMLKLPAIEQQRGGKAIAGSVRRVIRERVRAMRV